MGNFVKLVDIHNEIFICIIILLLATISIILLPVNNIPKTTNTVFNTIPGIPKKSLYDAKITDIKNETAEKTLSHTTLFPINCFFFLKEDLTLFHQLKFLYLLTPFKQPLCKNKL